MMVVNLRNVTLAITSLVQKNAFHIVRGVGNAQNLFNLALSLYH